jgi:hypothetical protein
MASMDLNRTRTLVVERTTGRRVVEREMCLGRGNKSGGNESKSGAHRGDEVGMTERECRGVYLEKSRDGGRNL